MDDLISRQAAIETIFNEPLYESGMKEKTAIEVVLAIYEKIKSLPSSKPERKTGEWIPCSERLPEDGTIALVCGKKGGIRVARVFIPYATGNWYGDPNTNWWTIVGTGKPFYPVAWMPLPEPYKGEE